MIPGSEVLAWIGVGIAITKGGERALSWLKQWQARKAAGKRMRADIEAGRKRIAALPKSV
jgi:hypothetical protein